MKKEATGYLEIMSAVAIWAISSGLIVQRLNVGAEIVYGVGAAAGFAFILIWILWQKKWDEVKKSKPWWKSLVLIGALIGINNGLFYAALKLTTVSNALPPHYLESILLVLIFAPIILKQKILKRHIIASFLGFIGLLIILWPQFNAQEINIGIFLGIASAVFFAWHTAIESKLATTTKIDPLVEVLYKNGVPVLMFLPFVVRKELTDPIAGADWIKLIFFGILVLGISFVLLYKGLAKVPSQSASVIFYGEPVGAIALAVLFGEKLNTYSIIGGTLILIAEYLATREKKT